MDGEGPGAGAHRLPPPGSGLHLAPGWRGLRLGRESRALIPLLGAMSALASLSIDSSLPALPAVAASLSAPPGRAGWTLSLFMVGFAFGQLVWGPASDRFGRRAVPLAGLVLYVLAGIGCAVAVSFPVLLGARLVQGLGACAGVVVGRAMVRDLFPGSEAAARQSALAVCIMVSVMAAPILGGALLGLGGWRTVYGALPAAGVVLAALVFLFLPETLPAAAPPARASLAWSTAAGYGAVLRAPRTLGFGAVNALTFGGMFAYVSTSPLVFIGRFGVTPGRFGLIFAAVAAAMICGSLLNGRLAPHLGLRRLTLAGVCALGLATAAVAVCAELAAGRPVLLALAAASYAGATGMVMPTAIATGMAAAPARVAGAASAVIGCLQMLVGSASAMLAGVLRPGTPGGMALSMALFAVPALAAALLLRRSEGRPGKPG